MRQFIELVLGDMVGNAIISKASGRINGKLNINIHRAFRYPEQLDDMVSYAEQYANEDIYLSPLIYGDMTNERGRISRTPANALQSNTIYQDSDTCPREKFRLEPSIHVTTSTGRFQDYWVLAEPIDAQLAAEISHRICTAHKDDGSDPSSWSANKVLRIPHSHNTSHGFPEQVTVEYTGLIYSDLDVAGAYEDVDVTDKPVVFVDNAAFEHVESEQELPDFNTTLEKLPSSFNTGLIFDEPSPEAGKRSEMRWRLLGDLFRLRALTFDEVLTIAWHAPSSLKWKADPRNIRGLIEEAKKMSVIVGAEEQGAAAPLEPLQMTQAPIRTEEITLLSDKERGELKPHFIDFYEEWSRIKLGNTHNAPYARMNAWNVLSNAFSDVVYVPRDNGPEGCNLYTFTLGETTTGKSQELKLMRAVLDEIFKEDPGYDLGGNASPNALGKKLAERDGKVSFFNRDEAHGLFKVWATQDWATSMQEDVALLYDGRVPPMLRMDDKAGHAKVAKTFFNIHFMGTPNELYSVLTRDMFRSGLLARFIWAIGSPSRFTQESMSETQSNGDYVRLGYEPWARQWAGDFATKKSGYLARGKGGPHAMMMSKAGLDRMSKVRWDMLEMFKDHREWDILKPSIIRLGNTIRRAATLLAASEGRYEVEVGHVNAAIAQAEEWLTNLLTVVDNVSDSDWKRDVDSVINFVINKGGRVRLELAYRQFASRKGRDLNDQIEAAIAQGYLKREEEGKARFLAAVM